MSQEIIGLHHWFQTPPGRYLLDWERAQLDDVVADIFGYHGLQLGLPVIDALRTNRMPYRWRASSLPLDAVEPPELQGLPDLGHGPTPLAFITDFRALPFQEASLDLVVLPHALELSGDPHATLREVHRVLVPEGKLVVCGLNPASLWGLRQWRARQWRRFGLGTHYLPESGELISERRLRDWLRLLAFEVEASGHGCWRPAVRSAHWLERTAWMDRLGGRWWPIFGAAYMLVASKRVPGMRLYAPWKSQPVPIPKAAAPVSIARRADGAGASGINHPENPANQAATNP